MNFSKFGIFAFATLAAVSAVQAAITGNVVDESGAPVKNAAVTVRTLPHLAERRQANPHQQG